LLLRPKQFQTIFCPEMTLKFKVEKVTGSCQFWVLIFFSSGADVMALFTAVIYRRSMALP